jgi:hypothetical protein
MGKDLSNFAVVRARLNSEGIIRARFQPVSLSLTHSKAGCLRKPRET